MIKLSNAIDRSFSPFMNDFGLVYKDCREEPTWSSAKICGRSIEINFYVEVVDHYASCGIVVDETDHFSCCSLAEEFLGSNEYKKQIKSKQYFYNGMHYGMLLQEIDVICDFIVIHLWPIFEGKRFSTPTYLLNPNCIYGGDIKTKMISYWIHLNEGSQPDGADNVALRRA